MKKAFALASLIALTVVITAGGAGAGTPAPLSTPELRKVIGSGKKHTLVFFQNPMGGPCKAQKEIVQRLLKDRKNGFNVANISTMKAEDQQAFYDYGVRNLPTIVLVDKKGAIANYFPPGIQSYETLAAGLDALK